MMPLDKSGECFRHEMLELANNQTTFNVVAPESPLPKKGSLHTLRHQWKNSIEEINLRPPEIARNGVLYKIRDRDRVSFSFDLLAGLSSIQPGKGSCVAHHLYTLPQCNM